MTASSVPFEIPNVNHGFIEVTGLLRINTEGILLEYHKKDPLGGLIHSSLEEVHLTWNKIEKVEFKRGFFSAKLIITGTSMKALAELPGVEQGKLTIKVKRKDRDDLHHLSSRVRLELSDMKLRELDD